MKTSLAYQHPHHAHHVYLLLQSIYQSAIIMLETRKMLNSAVPQRQMLLLQLPINQII